MTQETPQTVEEYLKERKISLEVKELYGLCGPGALLTDEIEERIKIIIGIKAANKSTRK